MGGSNPAASHAASKPIVVLDQAIALAKNGWRVFFAQVNRHPARGCVWTYEATNDPAGVAELYRRYPGKRVAIALTEGQLFVDVDVKNGVKGDQTFRAWAPTEVDPFICSEIAQQTPSGGWHFGFRTADKFKNGKTGSGVDLKTLGGYILHYPGSAIFPPPSELLEIPPWLAKAISHRRRSYSTGQKNPSATPSTKRDRVYANAALESACEVIRSAEEGSRNNTANEEAFKLGGLRGLDFDYAAERLVAAAVQAGLPEEEARRTILGALKAGVANPRTPPWEKEEPKSENQSAEPQSEKNDDSAQPRGTRQTTPDGIVTFADLLAEDLAPIKWLVDGLLPAVGHGFISAAPKKGKTWLALDLAIALLSGKPFVGRRVQPVDRPVLFIAAEGQIASLRKRLLMLCRGREIDPQSIAERLLIWPHPRLSLDQKTDMDRLSGALRQYQPAVAVVDCLSRVHRAEENSRSELEPILSDLMNISQENETVLVLVHHARSKSDFDPLRGSSALRGFHEFLIYLEQKEDDVLLKAELRDAEAPEPILVRCEFNDEEDVARWCVLDNNFRVRGTGRGDQTLEDKIIAFLRSHGAHTQTAIGKALKRSGNIVKGALRRLIEDGRIRTGGKSGRGYLYEIVGQDQEEDQ